MALPLVISEDVDEILTDKNIDWASMEGTNVLITGASGFLAAYLVETLLRANDTILRKKVRVIGAVRDSTRARQRFAHHSGRGDLEIVNADVSIPMRFDGPVDYLIHAASQASPRYFLSDPIGTIQANSQGTNFLLSLARQSGVRSFLYFSSGEVCGDIFDRQPSAGERDYGRVDPLIVRNCYAVSKMAGEALCAAYTHQHGLSTVIVRPSHTYGPGFNLDDGRAFASFVASVIDNRNIVMKSDGRACRSFLYLTDATRAYFTALLKGKPGEAYNVGNSYEISMLQLAHTILKASDRSNLKVEFEVESGIRASSAANHGLLRIEKMRDLGWEPRVSEEQGFRRTIRYYMSQSRLHA